MLLDLKTLWKIKRFRILLTARTLSNIGNGMSPIAMAFGVLSLPGSNASSLSWVTASHMVPIVLFLLLGGVVADRMGRARVVGVTDIIGAFVVATSGVLFLTDQATVPLLCVNAFVFGILNAMWWPAFAGLLPEVVPSENLQAANSLVGLGANVGFTLGATMGAGINKAELESSIYEVLLGASQGPRFGSFAAIYGLPQTIALIEAGANGELAQP